MMEVLEFHPFDIVEISALNKILHQVPYLLKTGKMKDTLLGREVGWLWGCGTENLDCLKFF